MLSVIMLSVIMLSIIMLIIIRLSAIMLSVVAPLYDQSIISHNTNCQQMVDQTAIWQSATWHFGAAPLHPCLTFASGDKGRKSLTNAAAEPDGGGGAGHDQRGGRGRERVPRVPGILHDDAQKIERLRPGTNVIKLFTVVSYRCSWKARFLSMASFCSLL